MLAHLVDVRLDPREAPAVAAWYVGSDFGEYVRGGHCIELLVRDAEKLRTEWVTGRRVTESGAREADALAERGETYRDVIDELRAEDEGSS